MQKVAVVILNYVNYKETFKCTESVLLQKDVDFEIIIVDNGSFNDAYKKLGDKYKNNPLIHILKANKNYGFAKGNNIGIYYARKKLLADFVLLLNSDIELIQQNYISLLISKMRTNIAVIGSSIIQKNGIFEGNYCDYTEFPDTLFFYLELFCGYYGFNCLSKKFSRLLLRTKKREILHGSCFMLTHYFFRHYKLLYSKTFLYGEEILLYIYCKNKGLKQLMVKEAVVLHKGKQSSKYLYNNRASIKDKYLLSSYKFVVWESFKAYIKNNRNLFIMMEEK